MREAKPFNPGDGSWAKGQFPPLPIAVFQALRSALPWQNGDRTQRDLEFIGPFLLQVEPGQPPRLWLPTPQDLVCVSSRTLSTEAPDSDPQTDDDNFDPTASAWERTARFQPLDPDNPAWKHFGFAPDFYSPDGLAPLVPPFPVRTHGADSSHNLNACSLHDTETNQNEGISVRPQPWIRADALKCYLAGEVLKNSGSVFHDNPWTEQVLSHIKVQPGTRQVESDDGYFTEVAVRLCPHWKLVAALSVDLEPTVVRLGGEGHRVLVTRLREFPDWDNLLEFQQPNADLTTAYLLTPGLAETEEGSGIYSLFPQHWKPYLRSCAGDRPLLWGGMSVYQKPQDDSKNIAFQPQRAFVKPGTVYRFKPNHLPQCDRQLLPQQGGNWLKTFQTLNYGTLLWGRS
jgi:CRISPR-associated protein Cmr3